MADEVNGKHKCNDAASVAVDEKRPVFTVLRPHLIVEAPKAAEAIQFYKRAFGAEEGFKSLHPKRKADQELPLILHALLKFGAAEVIVCDETDDGVEGVKSPVSLKGTTAILHLETDDVESAFKKAVQAGAIAVHKISKRTSGQVHGEVKDPYGFVWTLSTPIKPEAAAAEADAAQA
ncbi:hypothetical protein KI387_009475 [Taxus chinensis]|uniref:VOC domain-containing protein n=1 Tax=Taxus chinensis TaxID=29808 RepID=A0AA38CTB3_TAXCH|nr:hypothetical protein KI387_009475 [Taxus chinensis]